MTLLIVPQRHALPRSGATASINQQGVQAKCSTAVSGGQPYSSDLILQKFNYFGLIVSQNELFPAQAGMIRAAR
jgi:hypothetical protein